MIQSRIFGTLGAGQTSKVVAINNIEMPATLVVKGGATSAIEISADGIDWISPTAYYTSGTQVLVALSTPMNYVRFSGADNSEYAVL